MLYELDERYGATTNTEKILLMGIAISKRSFTVTEIRKISGLVYCHSSNLMKKLYNKGFLTKKKKGREVHYTLTKKGLLYTKTIFNYFTDGRPKVKLSKVASKELGFKMGEK